MLSLLQANSRSLADLLPAALMAEIRRQGRRATYVGGELIQQRGDLKRAFSIVESGQVLAGNVGADGAFLTTTLLNPGDYFGELTLFVNLPRTQNLWAIGATEITHVDERRFLALFDREPALPRALLTITLHRLHFVAEVMDAQRRWPLAVRIAHLLLTSVVDRTNAGHEVSCRQEDLATILGVSRVSIGKALKALQSEGLVIVKYGRILLPDVARLSAWVDDARQIAPIVPVAR